MSGPARVLVVGAGPAGLTLALQAHLHGAEVRVIDKRPEAFRPSRALMVHPRTLEVLRPLGVTDALLARAVTAPEVAVHAGSRVVPVRVGALPLRGTAFPHLSLLRQSDVETVLRQTLAERGVPVEFGAELLDLSGPDGHAAPVTATVRGPDGTVRSEFGFVAGCDGAASTVRSRLHIGWRGGHYRHEVLLADVELAGEPLSLSPHAALGTHGLLFVFPCGELATWRVLATRPTTDARRPHGQFGAAVPMEELQELLDGARAGLQLRSVAWSARVQLQHRLARHFRRGPVFLAGDAAHAHSPAAAQGMNTGIQDAANLGWKLAFAPRAVTADALLDSYEAERRPVARRVILLTTLAFWGESSTDPVASRVRTVLAPPLLPAVAPLLRIGVPPVTTALRVLTQLQISYRSSPLSTEASPRLRGRLRAGDRLPDDEVRVPRAGGDRRVRLHDLLAGPGIHLLLQRDADQPSLGAADARVRVHRLLDRPGAGVLAVRPDGYVGFRCRTVDSQLTGWLDAIGAR